MPQHPTILISLHSQAHLSQGANDDWSPDAPACSRAAQRTLPVIAADAMRIAR